jgi:hypothetical protein
MRAYIQHASDGYPTNVNTYAALRGFELLGAEVRAFQADDVVTVARGLSAEDVLVGYVGVAHQAFDAMGVPRPALDTWPEALAAFFLRRLWTATLGEVRASDAPVFIKPLRNVKTFPGHVRNVGRPDAMHTAMIADDCPIACSEVVEFESEWRCFVLEGRVLDVRRYKGTFRSSVDWSVLDAALESFRDQPAGFALDLGVLTDGRTAIVEVNDGYSVGAYGLAAAHYAQLLQARWREIVAGRPS